MPQVASTSTCSSGVNTASVEAPIFSRNAEQLNKPVADLMSQLLTLAVRLNGVEASVEFCVERIELKPKLELEAQMTMKQTRYLQLLSLGIISDDQFSLELLSHQLNRAGFDDVVAHAHADAALAAMRASSEPFELLFCNLQMPGIAGVEFVRHLVEVG